MLNEFTIKSVSETKPLPGKAGLSSELQGIYLKGFTIEDRSHEPQCGLQIEQREKQSIGRNNR
jgi:hypothetical protein